MSAHNARGRAGGTHHNFINPGTGTLELFTIDSPPEEMPGTVHKTKAETMAAHETEHK